MALVKAGMVTIIYSTCTFFFFLVFLPFLELLPQHMEVPRLGFESEL